MADCVKHKYGEPDQQGYVTCWNCGDTFNLAEAADEDEASDNYIDGGDGDFDDDDSPNDDFLDDDDQGEVCLTCGGSEYAHRSGCPEDGSIWY